MNTYLFVLFVNIFLNLIPIRFEKRKKYMLPLTFLILFVFLAIRYDYGVDYLTYERTFYYPELYSRDFEREPLFWLLFYSVSKYYQFVIIQTFLICGTYFYFVRKYISPKYYSFFFLVFMCYPGMMFTTIAAMRSSIAAVVFLWGAEFFYLRNYRPLYFVLSIIASYLCHQGSIQLLIIPIAHILLSRASTQKWVLFMIVGLIISLTSITEYIEELLGMFSEDSIGDYAKYLGERFQDSNISHAILRSFMLASGFLIYKLKIATSPTDTTNVDYKIATLAITYLTINGFGLDFQSRSAVLLFLFLIISLSSVLDIRYNKTVKYTIIALFVFYVLWYNYIMFTRLKMMIGLQGNFLFYQTIFDIPNLP